MPDLISIFRDELKRLEKDKEVEVAKGVDKIVTTEVITGIKAMFKVVGLTLDEAINAGVSDKMAEAMAYDIFKQYMTGGVH